MGRQQLIENAIKAKDANIFEAANPITKGLFKATNFSQKHPHVTAALLGALTAKFGVDIAKRMMFEGQNTVQSLTNPYYNSYGGYNNYGY